MSLLELNDLYVYYGGIRALNGLSLRVEPGEIVALVGANGAGKSTTLRAISGLVLPQQGGIAFMGENLIGLPAEDIVARGIIHVPEGRRIFGPLTVLENLEMGAYTVHDEAQKKRDLENVFELFPRLKERQGQLGGTLSGGEQQMLAIARALMGGPKLLLLDEPSMGLSPILVELIFDTIQSINEGGTSILLVEQNANMALAVADRGYVLESGAIALQGQGAELLEDPTVVEAYLGG